MGRMNRFLSYSILILTLIIVPIQANTDHHHNDHDKSGNWENVLLGFGLVIFGATLSTLGSMILFLDIPLRYIPYFGKDFSLSTSKPFLSSSLSFSTGVLVSTIFLNLISEGINSFHCSDYFGDFSGLAAALYFGACTSLVLLGKKVPQKFTAWRNSRKKTAVDETDKAIPFTETLNTVLIDSDPTPNLSCILTGSYSAETELQARKTSKKLGYEVAIAIALHNFPEGVVLFVSAYKSFETGILFGTALALHKFPEGIMIGVPIFCGTDSKWKAAGITAAASFVTQLLGATFAYLLFKFYWNDIISGLLFLLAGSILIHTAFHGMLPLARQYDPEDKYRTTWLCVGVAAFIFLTSVVKEPSSGTC